MKPYYDSDGITIHNGNCLDVMADMPAGSIDTIITDPPYGLEFMGKDWDRGVPGVPFWQAALRVAKPGAFLLSFGGTRTFHRLTCAIEDAGWEIRDCLMWLYGCLSEDTEILVEGKWEPYHKAIAGRRALCYDAEHGEYSWQPIEDLYVYDYADTAYRIVSDSTDQIVSRNHRCLVERGGGYAFQYAETLEREAHVPVLEDLPGLLCDLPLPQPYPGAQEPVLQSELCASGAKEETRPERSSRDGRGSVSCVRQEVLESKVPRQASQAADMLATMQWTIARERMGRARSQRTCGVDGEVATVVSKEDVRPEQSGMEGGSNVLPQARKLQTDQVRPVSSPFHGHGSQRRLRDGASVGGGASDWPVFETNGSGSSCQPRSGGQRVGKYDAICEQSGPQIVRGARYTRADLVRVDPMHYVGKVWCVKIPTGAFVARRNGKVFITGNSGFPKSHDISKALDKAAGAERKLMGQHTYAGGHVQHSSPDALAPPIGTFKRTQDRRDKTAPSTDAAKQWHGWGTALKPAWEPIILAMKPLDGTFAENALKHGVAGLNIDGARIPAENGFVECVLKTARPNSAGQDHEGAVMNRPKAPTVNVSDKGRWPTNVIHDGSDEVVELFPDRPAGGSRADTQRGQIFVHGGAHESYGDKGSAARFFYCAKASSADRGNVTYSALPLFGEPESEDRNQHPTVKPTKLMRYLCRLTRTPTGGIVLDPFMGSGSTLVAAKCEGRKAIGIEIEERYAEIAAKRLGQEVFDW